MQLTGKYILIGGQPIQPYVCGILCVYVRKMKNGVRGETRKAQDSLKSWWSTVLDDA